METSHQYDMENDEIQKIVITFYSIIDEKATYTIYFKPLLKSIFELGTEFEILSANINMKNKVS